jgi:hypothetical protein
MDLTGIQDYLTGAFSAAILWPTIKFLWDKLQAKEYIKGGAKKIGNLAGLKVYEKVLKHIPDSEAREKLKTSLDEAGDELDNGWDLGLDGEKI